MTEVIKGLIPKCKKFNKIEKAKNTYTQRNGSRMSVTTAMKSQRHGHKVFMHMRFLCDDL